MIKKKTKRKPRTSHSTIYEQLSKVPEVGNMIVTEREIGAMRRKMERQYKRILSESELKAIVRAEKLSRRQNEMKKRRIPLDVKAESKYYCRKCKSYHRIGSKIGRDHFEHFSHWIVAV